MMRRRNGQVRGLKNQPIGRPRITIEARTATRPARTIPAWRKDGEIQAVVRKGLGDRDFEPPGGPAAGRGGELDAGPGELAGGVLGGLAGVVNELVGVGEERGQDARGGQLLLVWQDLVREERPTSTTRLAQDAQTLRTLLGDHLGHVVAVDADGREALGAEAADHHLGLVRVAAGEALRGLAHLDDQSLLGRRQRGEGPGRLGIVSEEAREPCVQERLRGLVHPPTDPGEVLGAPGQGFQALVGLVDEEAARRVRGVARIAPRPGWRRRPRGSLSAPPHRATKACSRCAGAAGARNANSAARTRRAGKELRERRFGREGMVMAPRASCHGDTSQFEVRV